MNVTIDKLMSEIGRMHVQIMLLQEANAELTQDAALTKMATKQSKQQNNQKQE